MCAFLNLRFSHHNLLALFSTTAACPSAMGIDTDLLRPGTRALKAFQNRQRLCFRGKYDGSAAEVTGSGTPYDSISIKQVNANTLTYEAKQTNGKYHASGRTVISKDGKTMTTTAKGTDTNGAAMTLKLYRCA
jgi:hypothetical protein